MDRITENLIFEKVPQQFLYIGEEHFSIFARKGGKYVRTEIFNHHQLMKLSDSQSSNINKYLKRADTGIIFSSFFFIYNIIEFEKLPFKMKMCDEVVEWRLKKIFPDEISNYKHKYFKLNSKRVISILLKKETFEQLNNLSVDKPGIIGNSTVLAMNFILNKKWRFFANSPDLVIEVDGFSFIIIAQSKGIPFYLRKFKLSDSGKFSEEIKRTLNYVSSNYGKIIKDYQIVNHLPETDIKNIEQNLSDLKLVGKTISFSECLMSLK